MVVVSNKWDYMKKIKEIKEWNIPESEKPHLREFAKEYSSGRITGRIGKNIDATVEDALIKLKLPLTTINKSVEDMNVKDVKKFVDDLMRDKIKKKIRKNVNGKLKWVNNGNYAKKGKDKFLKNLSLYFKFRLKNNKEKLNEFLDIVKIIIVHVEEEVESISDKDYDNKLYPSCSILSDRFYLETNAWGGFRASEFHGITKQDIYLPDLSKGEEFVKIWVRHGNSKTKGRMIPLYGPNCYRVVKEYLESRDLKPHEIVYEKTHNSRKLWLRRLGDKLNIKGLCPKILRSTCATWLVDKGIIKDYTDLCLFFGWSFGSPVPKKYLNRSKIKLRGMDEKIKETRVGELKREIEKQKEISNIEKIKTTTTIEKIEKEHENFKKKMIKQLDILIKENPRKK